MEIHLTPEQEGHLARIAQHQGTTVAALLTDIALGVLRGDEDFRTAVRLGLEQADAGDFIEEAEMDTRFAKMLGG